MITAMPRIAIAVQDYGASVETFREGFGMPVADFSGTTVPELGAHVGMCQPAGGSNVELMAPSDPDAPLSQALQKFLDRRGEGLYALMLESPDPDAEAEELLAREMSVLPLMKGAGGRDIHPRSTHGVLIRVYPSDSVTRHDGLVEKGPGVSGIQRVIVATHDAEAAARAYGTGLGLEVAAPELDEGRGVFVSGVTPPKGGRIELVSVADTDRAFAAAIDRHVREQGEGMYGLVLRVPDGDAVDTLADQGLPVDDGPAGIEIDVFGTRVLIES